MVDFSKKNTKDSVGKYGDRDWTVNAARWLVFTFKSGFTGILYEWQATDAAGNDETIQWLLGDAEKLSNKLVVNDDGQLEDVDDDNKYVPRTNDPTSQLFNSMEDAGVPPKVLGNIGGAPEGVVGYTFHLVDKPTGKKQKKNGVETQYDQTWLVVESIVDSPSAGAKPKAGPGAKSAVKSTAAVAGKKPAKVVEPEPEEAEDDDEQSDDVDPIEAAAIATIQNVLSSPKKFVPTYTAKQNGGGLTTAQMRTAALGNATPKEHKSVSKADVSKLLGKPAVYEKYHGELWSFDDDNGVVSALD